MTKYGQNSNLKHCCLETQTLTILQLYWLCMITLKMQKGFSTIYPLIYNVIYYFSKYCIDLQNSWYVFVLMMCECVLLLCLLYQCKQIICACVCVCVLERAKHSFLALPNPSSCSVMNKICLNQVWPEKLHVLPLKFILKWFKLRRKCHLPVQTVYYR